MGAKRYGQLNGGRKATLNDYHQSKDELAGLPQQRCEIILGDQPLEESQAAYGIAYEILSSMLHGIGVGNMLPAWVPVVCVDINPAVVTKLADRGSSQTVGLVTDVGLFLHQLVRQLS